MEKLWYEKYRPKSLEEYIFENDQQRNYIEKIVKTRDLPHLLLTGQPGSGKTSLAMLLVRLLDVDPADVLVENASNKTGVDYIRDTIINFASTYPIGDFKIVRFEEVGYLSPGAQGMLRDILEVSSDTCRFIFTANEEHKIIPAIKSRFQHVRFKAPVKDDVIVMAANILISEGVAFDPEILAKFVDVSYPDLRKLIGNLQQFTINGELQKAISDQAGKQFELLELLEKGDIRAFSKAVLEQVPSEQYSEVFELVYRNLRRVPAAKNIDKYEAALVVWAKGLQNHSMVMAVPELNMEATLIELAHALG